MLDKENYDRILAKIIDKRRDKGEGMNIFDSINKIENNRCAWGIETFLTSLLGTNLRYLDKMINKLENYNFTSQISTCNVINIHNLLSGRAR